MIVGCVAVDPFSVGAVSGVGAELVIVHTDHLQYTWQW
jgi:hypothetical protein